MLEAGLSLIAACLPTVSYLLTHSSLHSALRSLRSKLSLHSIQTRESEETAAFGGEEEGPYTEINANGSVASHLKISNSDVDDLHELNELNQGIHVKHEMALNDRIV